MGDQGQDFFSIINEIESQLKDLSFLSSNPKPVSQTLSNKDYGEALTCTSVLKAEFLNSINTLSELKDAANRGPLYDIVINVDTINSLTKDGWSVDVSSYDSNQIKETNDSQFKTIGIIGIKGKGKTFLTQQLLEYKFPEKLKPLLYKQTNGISIKQKEIEKIYHFFVDSKGFDHPLIPESSGNLLTMDESIKAKLFNERNITDLFIKKFFMSKHVDMLIVVIGDLDYPTQKFVTELLADTSYTKDLYIVHNFCNIDAKDPYLKMRIDNDIKEAFGVRDRYQEKQGIFFGFVSNISNDQKRYHYHLVLTKHDFEKPESNHLNSDTFNFLWDRINALNTNRNVDLLSKFMEYCNSNLENYIKPQTDKAKLEIKLLFKELQAAKKIRDIPEDVTQGRLYLTLEKPAVGFEIFKYEEVNLELKKIVNERVVKPPYFKFTKSETETTVMLEVPDYDPSIHEDVREFRGGKIMLVFRGKKHVKPDFDEGLSKMEMEVKTDTIKDGEYFLEVEVSFSDNEIVEVSRNFVDGFLIIDMKFAPRKAQ